MKLLLINSNPVVNRMMNIGAPKAGYELQSIENVNEIPTGEYNVIIVDDELYDKNLIELIKEKIKFDKIGIIAFQPAKYQESFDFVLPKPFLPTDLVELLRKLKEEIASAPQSEQPVEVDEEEPQNNPDESREEVQETQGENQEEIQEESNEETQEEAHEETQEEAQEEAQDSVETIGEEVLDIPKESDESVELTPEISLERVERDEPLVEVHEEEEEPPFVDEDLQKSGVLDEEEIKKVSELLEEEREDEEHADIAAQEPQDILTDFSEDEEEQSQERDEEEQPQEVDEVEQPQEVIDEQEAQETTTEDNPEQTRSEYGEEEDSKEDIEQEQNDTLEVSMPSSSANSYIKEQKDAFHEEAKEQLHQISQNVQSMGVPALKQLLDGMELEIKIKISFPGK